MKTQILFLCAMLLCLAHGPASAQSSAQAGDMLELQSPSQRTIYRIKPKARLGLYGRAGTAPVKGNLVSANDTIVLRNRKLGRLFRVPASSVTAVRQYKVGFQIIAGLFAFLALLFLTWLTAFLIVYSGTGGFAINIILTFFFYGLNLTVGLMILFGWLGARKFRMPRWKILSAGH